MDLLHDIKHIFAQHERLINKNHMFSLLEQNKGKALETTKSFDTPIVGTLVKLKKNATKSMVSH